VTEGGHTGRLLVASPALADSNFRRTVVLVLDHAEEGALGVVINRPTEVTATEVLASWGGMVSTPDLVFAGGPVSTDSALGIAAVPDVDGPVGWKRLYDGTGLVDLDAPPELLSGALRGLRIFAGYAGWSPGQLENELAEGAWFVVPAEADDVFTTAPGDLWRRVLCRQPSRLALLSTFPDDPGQN
jgi:putative transcriptional regulator